MTTSPAPRCVRSPFDQPLVTELPAGTTDGDYHKWYWCMGAAEFYAALARLQARETVGSHATVAA